MSLHLHAHTIKTTVADLAETLDEWGDSGNDVSWQYVGGRDALVVVRHQHAPVEDHDRRRSSGHGTEDPRALASIGCDDVAVAMVRPVQIEHYGPDHRYFAEEGGAALPSEHAGLVEDVGRTWALWYGHDGRPRTLWLHRGADGEVLGSPINLTDTVYNEIDAWMHRHPDLAADGSNIANAVRLLDAVYDLPADAVSTSEGRVQTRDLLAVAGTEKVTAEHQVYVRVFYGPAGKNEVVPATKVVTVNGGRGLAIECAPLTGVAATAFTDLVGWMEDHTDLIGEGSAVDNVLRLLDHAYNEEGCSDPRFLSDNTPALTRVPAGQQVRYEIERRPRDRSDYDTLAVVRRTSWDQPGGGRVGNTEDVITFPLPRTGSLNNEEIVNVVSGLLQALTG